MIVVLPRTNTLTHCAKTTSKNCNCNKSSEIYTNQIPIASLQCKYQTALYLFLYCLEQTNLDELFKLQKRCARLILDSPRDARSYDNFQKLKWLPGDQLFKLNKFGLLKNVIDGRAPEYLITTLDSLRFEHKYSTRTKPLYRLPKPRTEAMRRTFF